MNTKKLSGTFKTSRPLGPLFGHTILNQETIDHLLRMTDDIYSNNKKLSYGNHLAGQIEKEYYISKNMLEEHDVYNFLNNIQMKYVEAALDTSLKKFKTDISSAWFNMQYENEYNPLHWHENCSISSVIYLKVPKFEKRGIPNKSETDGKIVFVGNNHSYPTLSFESPYYIIEPVVGHMYTFPSRVMHCVYPFKGCEERRSISLNGYHYPDKNIQG